MARRQVTSGTVRRSHITQEVLERHFSDRIKLALVLFDEVEKASEALWQLLLGILDKATLTLGDNRRVDFSRSMIFLTSNLGSQELMRLMIALLRLLKHIGKKSADGVEVSLSREELAQMTGTTLFTISRLLSKWSDEGFVLPRREAVLIRDPERLAQMGDQADD